MVHESRDADPFKDLSWNDLESWAGRKSVSRGKRYQKDGRVFEIARTSTGGLIAWVQGDRKYATRVEWTDDELTAECSCPYWGRCKHAVAVIVEYLDRVRKGKSLPCADRKDQRLQMLQEPGGDELGDRALEISIAPDPQGDAPETAGLLHFLESKTKAQLVNMLLELAALHQVVRRKLNDAMALARGTSETVVASILRDIDILSAQPPGGTDSSRRDRHVPDYSLVRDRLRLLAKEGYADDVIAIGEKLLEAGTAQVEESYDEGETAAEISHCMEVVFQALMESSLSIPEQILRVLDAEREDAFDLCTGTASFWAKEYAPSDWSMAADLLLARLDNEKPQSNTAAESSRFRRDRMSDQCITALDKAGRKEDIFSLCEREAERTGSYMRLVGLLIRSNRLKDAERWIDRGIQAVGDSQAGTAHHLRSCLREIREKQDDWQAVSIMRVEEFVSFPCVQTYKELKRAALKANLWQEMRISAIGYLETGKIALQGIPSPPSRNRLPEPAVRRRNAFPEAFALLDIAIFEEQPDEVLRWYENIKSGSRNFGLGTRLSAIAAALARRHPDRAVAIWKELAEEYIASTNLAAYEAAATCMANIRETLGGLGRKQEWLDYLEAVKQANRRKRRLLEVLGSMEGRRILDTS